MSTLRTSASYGILLLLAGWTILSAQPTLGTMTFTGNRFYSQRQLRDLLSLQEGMPFPDTSAIRTKAEQAYRAEGFYGAAVGPFIVQRSEDTLTADLTIPIIEGTRTLVGAVRWSGNAALSTEQLQGMMTLSTDAPLDPEKLAADITGVLHRYSAIGFPFASVADDSTAPDPEDAARLVVRLRVTEGPRMTVNEVRVTGNTLTSPAVVLREAQFGSGVLFDQRMVDAFKQRLDRLQLFSTVSEPQLYVLPGASGDTLRGGIAVAVTEGNANTFDGILGYVPPTGTGAEGYLTGSVTVAMRNLFGTGRKAMVRWQRETALTQELELQYKEPWLFGVPLSLSGLYRQRKQDSTFVRSAAELRMEYRLNDALTVAGSIATEAVVPSADIGRFTVFQTDIVSFGADLLYDTRDNVRNPTDGVRYATAVQQGTKNITGPEQYLTPSTERSFTLRRLSVDAEVFLSTFLRQVVMLAMHGKQINASRLEFSDLLPLGGTTTIRGYRENQFFASQFAYITAEYRFLTGRASSFFGFADGGYLFRPADALHAVPSSERGLYGFGAGARVETGLGIMNITFALGQGDSFSNGKIHVGLVNEF